MFCGLQGSRFSTGSGPEGFSHGRHVQPGAKRCSKSSDMPKALIRNPNPLEV